MNNSNWNLRFPRTSREAFGYTLPQEEHRGDKWVGLVAIFVAGFLLGLAFLSRSGSGWKSNCCHSLWPRGWIGVQRPASTHS